MLSKETEALLHAALAAARDRRQPFAGVDHLLYVLLDDDAVAGAVSACRVSAGRLRDVLREHINGLERLAQAQGAVDSKPSAGFQRALQRAAIHVQAAKRGSISSVDLLLGLLSEREAFGIQLLEQEGATAAAIRTTLLDPPQHDRT